MKAIILAGGRGTRLSTVISDVPKPMAPINGRPFLEFLISKLVSNGIDKIILSVGYLHQSIINHFEDGRHFGASIEYLVEPEPLGTGGAIREAMKLVNNKEALVMNGDTFVALDIQKFINFHRQTQKIATMALIPIDDASRYGAVKISPDGIVTSFSEKSSHQAGFINAGVYIFNQEIINHFPEGRVSLETDILPILAITGNLAAQPQKVPFIDIGIPSAYHEFCLNHSTYI